MPCFYSLFFRKEERKERREGSSPGTIDWTEQGDSEALITVSPDLLPLILEALQQLSECRGGYGDELPTARRGRQPNGSQRPQERSVTIMTGYLY